MLNLPTPLFVRAIDSPDYGSIWHVCVRMPNGAAATRSFARFDAASTPGTGPRCHPTATVCTCPF